MEIVIATLVVGVIGLAHVNPALCVGCGLCAGKCPVKVISGGDVKSKAATS